MTSNLRHFNIKGRQGTLIPVTQKSQQFARRLLAFEVAREEGRTSQAQEQFRVCEKLRQPLSSFAGTMAFQALIGRALTLTKAEIPRLAPAKVGKHGCLEHLADIEPRLSADEASIGEVVLIGHLMDLLCAFLGEALALRLIQEVWTGAAFDEADDGKGTEA